MSRRGNLFRSGRRGGGGGAAAPFNPLSSPKLIEPWLSYAGTTDDGAGLISAWAGRRLGRIYTAATTARPTLTAGQFGALPGLVFDGASDIMACTTVGADITGKTGLTVIMVLLAPGNLTTTLLEYSVTWFLSTGTFTIAKTTTNATTVACRGTTGNSISTSGNNSSPLVVPGVLSADFNMALTTLEASQRLDNVALPFTQTTDSNNGSTFGNFPLYLGGRGTGTLFSPVTVGAVAIYDTLTPAELTVETRGYGSLFGGIVVA